jgi:hypothetical protein
MNIYSRIKNLERKQQERESGHRPGGKESRELFLSKLKDIAERLQDSEIIFAEMSLAEKQAILMFYPERFTPEQQAVVITEITHLREQLQSGVEGRTYEYQSQVAEN